MLIFLCYAAIITPYRTAFFDYDSIGWIIADTIVDLYFLADLILNFFTAYFNEDMKLVVSRTDIAKRYLKTWFSVDFIALVPFHYMIPGSSRDYSSLARISRLPRLYKLLKMIRYIYIYIL